MMKEVLARTLALGAGKDAGGVRAEVFKAYRALRVGVRDRVLVDGGYHRNIALTGARVAPHVFVREQFGEKCLVLDARVNAREDGRCWNRVVDFGFHSTASASTSTSRHCAGGSISPSACTGRSAVSRGTGCCYVISGGSAVRW